MSDLRTLQHDFLAYLLDGDPAIADAIVDQAADSDQGGRDTRLGIYANAYRLRLRETLETDHEMLGLYLGDDLWDQLADGYIQDQPSTFRSLRQYGDALPTWLAGHEPFSEHSQIAELAAFERRLLSAFDAPDAPRAEPAQLAELAERAPEHWPGLTLRFHPSVQPFPVTTDCIPIWQALKAGQTPPPVESDPATWLLWRGEDRLTEFRSMPEHEALLLTHFLNGGDFADACELLLPFFDAEAIAGSALALLSGWLRDGLVRELVTPG